MLLPPMRMRALPLLLLLAGCMVAQRPPPAPPPAPRFSAEAERQGTADLCRRMADWDCENLDCPDCSAVAERARARDFGETMGALAALGLAAGFFRQTQGGQRIVRQCTGQRGRASPIDRLPTGDE